MNQKPFTVLKEIDVRGRLHSSKVETGVLAVDLLHHAGGWAKGIGVRMPIGSRGGYIDV
jgi:hypothetical protein